MRGVTMKEEWKTLDINPIYQISNTGKIYSSHSKKILKIHKDRYGYCIVNLSVNNKPKTFSLHRLVANAFLENPNNLYTVNHIDNNKDNNCVSNLEFMSVKDNVRYTQAKKVYQYDKSLNLIKIWDSVMDIERELKYCSSSICYCCLKKKRYKTCHNYIWSYTPLK